jgi:hypothetical protein
MRQKVAGFVRTSGRTARAHNPHPRESYGGRGAAESRAWTDRLRRQEGNTAHEVGHPDQRRGRWLESGESGIAFTAEPQDLAEEVLLLGKWRNKSPSEIPAASASSFVVVPANPLRAKSGTAAATIALRSSSLYNRVMAMARRSKHSLTKRQAEGL